MAHRLNPAARLGEVKLKVSNMERSLAFYQDVIGFQVLTRNGNIAELTADGSTALVVLEEVPNAYIVPQRSASGLYHYAILLPTRKALGKSLRRLLDKGIQVGQADHWVSEALYISDPDSNGIEIYRDRPRDEWEYNEQGFVKMGTDPIDWHGLLAEAEGEEWGGLPQGTVIGHVHFHVGDLHKSKQFYCDALGFDIEADLMRQMGALFIGAGRYHHHVGLNLWAGAGAPQVPANGTGISYFTVILPNEEELEKTAESLEQHGFAVQRDGRIRWVGDPNGISVKLEAEA
ncbi:VOC family protein [Paenibacillus soyae]|uniref:VOC family protein n=1 Tax=Paenibacillus soyae TaxID=2969249 RepID=A0A9X2MPR4_9BACL|nr:VOC family protein [Paenibacillus soyae]MCR2803613.1 VOC family protein [Paenibacillus soyae]